MATDGIILYYVCIAFSVGKRHYAGILKESNLLPLRQPAVAHRDTRWKWILDNLPFSSFCDCVRAYVRLCMSSCMRVGIHPYLLVQHLSVYRSAIFGPCRRLVSVSLLPQSPSILTWLNAYICVLSVALLYAVFALVIGIFSRPNRHSWHAMQSRTRWHCRLQYHQPRAEFFALVEVNLPVMKMIIICFPEILCWALWSVKLCCYTVVQLKTVRNVWPNLHNYQRDCIASAVHIWQRDWYGHKLLFQLCALCTWLTC